MEEIANALELKNELDSLRPIDKEKEAIIMQKFPFGLELPFQSFRRKFTYLW